jgi:hypothetical protein
MFKKIFLIFALCVIFIEGPFVKATTYEVDTDSSQVKKRKLNFLVFINDRSFLVEREFPESSTISEVQESLADWRPYQPVSVLLRNEVLDPSIKIESLDIKENEALYVITVFNESASATGKVVETRPVLESDKILILGASSPEKYKESDLPKIYRVCDESITKPNLFADVTRKDHMSLLPSNHFEKVQSEHLPINVVDNPNFLETVHRVLVPGGIYEVSVWDESQWGNPKQKEHIESFGFKYVDKGLCQL